jgi:hypothetical protein
MAPLVSLMGDRTGPTAFRVSPDWVYTAGHWTEMKFRPETSSDRKVTARFRGHQFADCASAGIGKKVS